MAEPVDLEEDLFADLYDADDGPQAPAQEIARPPPLNPPVTAASPDTLRTKQDSPDRPPQDSRKQESQAEDTQNRASIQVNEEPEKRPASLGNGRVSNSEQPPYEQESHTTGIKEDGKMFIGGLNWETTDQSLKEYFSQFGEVLECTVMRDGVSGRSRGFGFLTFRDPKTVNIVMVKEHHLDGKIIDPKRAIPRDEQERTSKIFVGGVSQEATEQHFKEFFMQFGRVLDATLMIDKDTGRPRGFGFVTFDSEAAVEATLDGPLEILGKPIEVKKAQPRGNLRDNEEERDRRYGRRGKDGYDRFERDGNRQGGNNDNQDKSNSQMQNQQSAQGMYPGMTPQVMAQYWARMQQYMAIMQQQMVAAQNPGMGGMNPAVLQQLAAMQAMSQGQNAQGSQSPQSPGSQGMQTMTPALLQQMQQAQQLQQMQQMQQVQAQAQQQQEQAAYSGNMGGSGSFSAAQSTPAYNAYEQQAFEQRKYEQQSRRTAREQHHQSYQQYPTSWEGMYDDVPQPTMAIPQGPMSQGSQHDYHQRQMTPNQGKPGNQNRGSQGRTPTPQSAPPANAPTGPKNAGKPGANYRGGGRGGGRGFHPYPRG